MVALLTCAPTSSSRTATLLLVFLSTMSIASGRRMLFSGVRRGQQLAAFVGTKDIHRSFGATRLFSSVATSNNDNNLLSEEYAGTTLPIQKNSHNSVKIIVPAASEDKSINNDLYDPTTFHTKLEATITAAQQLGKTAIWITIPICSARLIEEASKLDFEFHHAEGTTATLNKWISSEESRIPTYATHQVGVGAVVINSNDEILVVREKRRNYRPWKVPGGLAELGEDLDEAVEREVLEETGIQTKFQSVLGVRHVHGAQFGRSDLFFVCRLEPIPDEESGSIPCPVAQEGEIEAVSWQPLKEYRDMVFSEEHGHPMMQQIMRVVDQGLEQDWEETDIQRLVVGSVVPGRKPSPVYHAPIRSLDSDESP